MPPRELPARPHLDHLKNEAKALRNAFLRGEPDAVERVRAVLGPRTALKLTEAQRRHASPELLAALEPTGTEAMIEAARNGRLDVVRAWLAAGFPVGAQDENGATALHHACIGGRAAVVHELIARGAALDHEDREHQGTPVDWACYGADHDPAPDGDYAGCVRALLEAGARPRPPEWWPQHAGVREVFEGPGAR